MFRSLFLRLSGVKNINMYEASKNGGETFAHAEN